MYRYLSPKLPFATRVHHCVAVVLVLFVCATDVTASGFGGTLGAAKMAVVYGNFSTVRSCPLQQCRAGRRTPARSGSQSSCRGLVVKRHAACAKALPQPIGDREVALCSRLTAELQATSHKSRLTGAAAE